MNALRLVQGALSAKAPPIAPRARVIGGLIALVAAATGFLAAAGALTGFAADRIAGRWSAELSAVATVRVSAPAEGDTDAIALSALAVLESTPGVASAHLLSEAESRALLSPWLGPDADIAALPVPALIDVQLEPGGPDVEEVRRRLALDAPGAVWDDHREWRAPLIVAARGLRRAAAAGVLLSTGALAAMVAVAATATLWSGSGVVRTLKLIGAEDRFISRAFERPFALRAAIGAGLGALVAALIAANMPPVEGIENFTAGGLGADWRVILITPFAAALIAGLTALGATRAAAHFVLRGR
ncbi:cell division protein FtsX [Pikeienuella piscinae]|uniref:Cell division protein FtsX n=1 Tax=Pikeienuella piscinae TaxID=2748098 RepID=A0A7L5BVD4_9RHOB|nr:cell division protein FtsX [Pikeienuella piscinae]QIE54768.1 cell division protein FtsX [Pikeienuella piscinae]